MLPKEPIDPEIYEYYRIPHNFAEEFTARLGHDPFEGKEVGLNWQAQLHNVLYTIPESVPMYEAVASLPPGASLVLPVTMGNLYSCIGLLAPTHQIRVVAPGNVGDGSEQLPQEVLRRVTMESLFRKDPAQLKPGQNPLRFSAAGFLAKAETFWASQKQLISQVYVPNMGAYTWPLAAQLLRGILMHMGETQKGFEDIEVLEWIRGHDATQIRGELNGSKSFARKVLLPDENLERLASLREVLYRSLEWVNEYAEWKGENTGTPPIEAEIMDFQELRKGAAPTAALILVPKLGIDTPAWVGGVLGMVFSQAELELLGEQAGRPVVWVTTPETIAPGLTDVRYLLVEQAEHRERNTAFYVFLRKEEQFYQKIGGQEYWQTMLNSVGVFILNRGLRHRLSGYVEKRLGDTVVNLRSEARSASMQMGMFPLPASASVSQSESVQPRYRAADLMSLVSSEIQLLVVSTPELPASGQVLPIADPNRWRKPTPTTPLDAIKLLQEQLNFGMPGNNLRITPHSLTNNQLATAQGQVGNLFPNSPPVRGRLVEELNWGCIVCMSLLVVLAYVVGHLLRWW